MRVNCLGGKGGGIARVSWLVGWMDDMTSVMTSRVGVSFLPGRFVGIGSVSAGLYIHYIAALWRGAMHGWCPGSFFCFPDIVSDLSHSVLELATASENDRCFVLRGCRPRAFVVSSLGVVCIQANVPIEG